MQDVVNEVDALHFASRAADGDRVGRGTITWRNWEITVKYCRHLYQRQGRYV